MYFCIKCLKAKKKYNINDQKLLYFHLAAPFLLCGYSSYCSLLLSVFHVLIFSSILNPVLKEFFLKIDYFIWKETSHFHLEIFDQVVLLFFRFWVFFNFLLIMFSLKDWENVLVKVVVPQREFYFFFLIYLYLYLFFSFFQDKLEQEKQIDFYYFWLRQNYWLINWSWYFWFEVFIF